MTPVVKPFLEEVYSLAADYITTLSNGEHVRAPHYEDLFSLTEQATRTFSDFVPNLAVTEFARELRKRTATLHVGKVDGFNGLAERVCDFLHWVVHQKLGGGGSVRRGLDAISETAQAVDSLDIFTLNHDLLIERELRENEIEVDIGFNDDSHGEFSVYCGWLHDRGTAARLFKLHGSLNWYLYEFPEWARQYDAIPTGRDAFHSQDVNGNIVKPVEWKAAFLSGTVVKEQRYGLGFWGDLFSQFRQHLSRHRHLICCGYGFGDTGVNQRLNQWAHDRLDGSNTFVILTPLSPAEFLHERPYWLRELHAQGQVKFIPKYLDECGAGDLQKYFDVE